MAIEHWRRRMSEESTQPGKADDDLHRKFREALERKKNTKHPSAALGEEGDGKNTFATKGSTKRKREFRRKSG